MIKRIRNVTKVATEDDPAPVATSTSSSDASAGDEIGPGGDEESSNPSFEPQVATKMSLIPAAYNRYRELICHFCHQRGHICPQCPVKDAILCVRCFERGHFDRWCPQFGKRVLYKL
jgi:hypothetical protein